ncbi:hypothetical protein Agub_g6367 [Astrephomene gubernaculifera]|uniref:Uncharacterized protein n=1 Tax=Astrephomene gubernaculifera TaxID=47775 RepID=A0AAD3HLR8_9CHLO|nr:hypothetical protein Agub_g6367 [Astrephomene gubernaculifera]
MELLLCIVEANSAAKALANAGVRSLHVVHDCGHLVDACNKVIPAALSALECAASGSADVAGQAVECVQGLTSNMVQLQAALEALSEHDSEGLLGVLMEHPSAWLDTYRAFRGLTQQLVALRCLIRASPQRCKIESADEAIQASVKTLQAICARAREAANLLGSDLPEFARAAAAAGWSPERLRQALRVATEMACPRCGNGCPGSCGPQPSTSAASPDPSETLAPPTATVSVPTSPSGTHTHLHHHPHRSPGVGTWALLRIIGKAASSGGANPATKARGSTASSFPGSTCGASPTYSSTGLAGCGSLDDAISVLVSRIQEIILYDSEVDQLEQDRAYLQHRVAHLREAPAPHAAAAAAPAGCTQAAAAAAATAEAARSEAAATESLVQSKILLAAVNARLQAVNEAEGSGASSGGRLSPGENPVPRPGNKRRGMEEASGAAAKAGAPGLCGATSLRRVAASSIRLAAAEQDSNVYDDVRKRRSGLRWLPTCFVGA